MMQALKKMEPCKILVSREQNEFWINRFRNARWTLKNKQEKDTKGDRE